MFRALWQSICSAKGEENDGHDAVSSVRRKFSDVDVSSSCKQPSPSLTAAPSAAYRPCGTTVLSPLGHSHPALSNASARDVGSPARTDAPFVLISQGTMSSIARPSEPHVASQTSSIATALSSAFDVYLPDAQFRSVGAQQRFWSLPEAFERHLVRTTELMQRDACPLLLQQALDCFVLVCWGRRLCRGDLLAEALLRYADVLQGVRALLAESDDEGIARAPTAVFVLMQYCVLIEVRQRQPAPP